MNNEDFNINIGKVSVAHKFVLTKSIRCDYLGGRKICGLSYAIAGNATILTESGKRIVLKENDVVFMPASSSYVVESQGEYQHYTVNFDIDYSSGIEDDITVLHAGVDNPFKNLFSKLCFVWDTKPFAYQMTVTRYIYKIFELFFADIKSCQLQNNKHYQKVLPAINYIDKNFDKSFSVDDLAKICLMSTTSFRRTFSLAINKTSIEYRDEKRLAKAKDYLSCGLYSVSYAALACGFDDVNYFCRFFKKHVNQTPKEFMSDL
jgi:AraC-like DNA-binding protein